MLTSPPLTDSQRSGLPGSLTIDRLSKRYGTVLALDEVSIEVERGRFVTLLGPSGSGKTTLLMAIAGFVAPSGGAISLDGRPIDHLPPERRDFGMVFQGYALFPHLTVAENVAFPLRVRRQPRAEIEASVRRVLETVQLAPFADRLPRQLSGGQQQRAALARALVFQPKLVLLDEPLSALDKNLRADLQVELKGLHERLGLTFVYVTHDQQEALSMSDEVAILRDGRLIQKGTPRHLYERPASRFVAGFLGRSNFVSGTVEQVSAHAFTYRCGAFALHQAWSESPPATGTSVLVTVRPEKIRILAGRRDDSACNKVVGCVTAFSYLGGLYHLVVDIEHIGRFTVDASTSWHVPVVGEEIVLGWDEDASVQISDQ
jgi:putative spermidine/putrescine transport system ATP-binding protein